MYFNRQQYDLRVGTRSPKFKVGHFFFYDMLATYTTFYPSKHQKNGESISNRMVQEVFFLKIILMMCQSCFFKSVLEEDQKRSAQEF